MKQTSKETSTALRVGHIFLDARDRRVLCLNQAARDLHAQGVPLAPADLKEHPLHDAEGRKISGKELPLISAWHSAQPEQGQFFLPRGNTSPWQITWTASPVHDADNKLLGVVATVACEVPDAHTRLMAELAHDLRTPLQSLRLLCALMERSPAADADTQRTLEAIRMASDRAIQIALELLQVCRGPVARIGGNEFPWFALDAFLVSLAAEQAVTANEKGLTLSSDFTAVEGWEIQIDRARLGRVLSNLLVNAVRYTPRGRVNFTATWENENGKQSLHIGVVDTGPGMSDEEQESIFQAYERGKAGKRAGDSSGSGLGLAVVDRLVEELGLTLDVFSQYGRGSAFHLRIPMSMLRQKQS